MSDLHLRPIYLKQANEFVTALHRHHKGNARHRWSVAVEERGRLVGVAIVGRPKSRVLDNGRRAEVVRVCTDGTPNACSMLYGAAARAAVNMGYQRHNVFTYILESEDGTSLKAAGWVKVAETKGGSWDTPTRRRTDKAPLDKKERWHAAMPPEGWPGCEGQEVLGDG